MPIREAAANAATMAEGPARTNVQGMLTTITEIARCTSLGEKQNEAGDEENERHVIARVFFR